MASNFPLRRYIAFLIILFTPYFRIVLASGICANNNICIVWSQLTQIRSPLIVTIDFLLIRFNGDRTIQEKDFGKIQKDCVSEMKNGLDFFRAVEQEQGKNSLVIVVKRSLAGFGPGTANIFRRLLDLSSAAWNNIQMPQTK